MEVEKSKDWERIKLGSELEAFLNVQQMLNEPCVGFRTYGLIVWIELDEVAK